MPKITKELIESSIENFNMEQPSDVLSEAFKNAKTQQEFHKQTSVEFRTLEAFKKKVMTKIRAIRKGPSIEEQDKEMVELMEDLDKRKSVKGK